MTTATKAERRFYIARNPDVSHADVLLAKAAPYDRLETALQDMGGGVIFDERGEIVAFHERHFALLEHRGAGTVTPRMTHFSAATP